MARPAALSDALLILRPLDNLNVELESLVSLFANAFCAITDETLKFTLII